MNNDTPLPIVKVKTLRECDKNEYWLQDRIFQDPSILGLGEQLEPVTKEKSQTTGGRLDMLLKDPNDDSMFEVEVMLGETDPSHIIRTIEYWDSEKRRWPKRQHTAVLVAEHINTRFFNVIQILSHAIPIIGIQVAAVELEGKLGLQFSKIIDTYQEPEDGTEPPPASEDDWKSDHPDTLNFAKNYEKFAKTLLEDVTLRYLKGQLKLRMGGQDRVWIYPTKNAQRLGYNLEENGIDALQTALEAKGIFPKRKEGPQNLTFKATNDSLTKFPEEHKKLLLGLYAKGLKKRLPN